MRAVFKVWFGALLSQIPLARPSCPARTKDWVPLAWVCRSLSWHPRTCSFQVELASSDSPSPSLESGKRFFFAVQVFAGAFVRDCFIPLLDVDSRSYASGGPNKPRSADYVSDVENRVGV